MQKQCEDLESIYDRLRLAIRKGGFKNSKQREFILKILHQNQGEHLGPDDIFVFAKAESRNASVSSIYRILAFLEQEGFVRAIETDKRGKRYEIASCSHHDHMICLECGEIIEFVDTAIEERQEKIAKSHGAKIIGHDMRLFVLCKVCQKKF